MPKYLFPLSLALLLSFVDQSNAAGIEASEPQLIAQMELRNTCEMEYETYYDPTSRRMERRSEYVCRPRLRFEENPNPNPSRQSSPNGREFYFRNNCPYPIRLVMHYRELSGEWTTKGWWNFNANSGSYLASNGQRIPHGGCVWC